MHSRIAALLLGLVFALPAAAQLPSNYSIDTLASTFRQPVALDFLADGRVVVAEQFTGAVKVFAGGAIGTLGVVPGLRVDVISRGLLGLAVDPGWPLRPYLYTYSSHPGSPGDHRVLRHTVVGALSSPGSTALGLGSSYVVLQGIPDQNPGNNGGALRFGPDGMLYVGIGDDAGDPCLAQNNDDLRGVVLRLDVSKLPAAGGGPPLKSLLVPAGNPFTGPNDNARLTFAYGLRNPFRIGFDPVTGRLFIADVGENSMEEVDECRGGENFGWPWFEGTRVLRACGTSVPLTTVPIATYGREIAGSQAISVVVPYRNVRGGAFNFGNEYEGNVFYGDYYGGWLRRVAWDGNRWSAGTPVPGQPSVRDWAQGVILVADARVGPDGAIWFVHLLGGLYRLRHNPLMPAIIGHESAFAGKAYGLICRHLPGNPVTLFVGLASIAPTPVPGVFGRVELLGFPVAAGSLSSTGSFEFGIPEVPVQAIGLAVYFQCVVTITPNFYLSPLHKVMVKK